MKWTGEIPERLREDNVPPPDNYRHSYHPGYGCQVYLEDMHERYEPTDYEPEWVQQLREWDRNGAAVAHTQVTHLHWDTTSEQTEQTYADPWGRHYRYECTCGDRLQVNVADPNLAGRLI
jgi:hypothetical protein